MGARTVMAADTPIASVDGDLDWLSGDGEMAGLIRSFNWNDSALGCVRRWSPALKTTLRIMLANRFPHILWWGPRHIQFYNDAYIPIPGSKHPKRAFGIPGDQGWSEIWDIIGPLVERPFKGGAATLGRGYSPGDQPPRLRRGDSLHRGLQPGTRRIGARRDRRRAGHGARDHGQGAGRTACSRAARPRQRGGRSQDRTAGMRRCGEGPWPP